MRKLKPGWIIALAILTLGIGVAVFPFLWPDRAQRELEQTRRELRQQGFKIDLAEFDLSASADQKARASALIGADLTPTTLIGTDFAWHARLPEELPDLMMAAASNAAVVVWKQEKLEAHSVGDPWLEQSLAGQDLWKALRETLTVNRAGLDAACTAALSGPIRVPLAAQRGAAMLLPHLPAIKKLERTLGTRCVLELHDGNRDAAWTNLLAATRLVTAWDPEPAEVSHLVRCGCAVMACNTAWQVLQAGGWPDDRLAQLQREWESVDFFKSLPETEAFARAAHVAACQLERQAPPPQNWTIQALRQSPVIAWNAFVEHWRCVRYRHYGSYEDERALLLYHRDRELQFRRAVQARTWLEMRQLPGVTNSALYQSRHRSRTVALINMRQASMGYARQGKGLFGQAAEAEARRRLLVTALALERYRSRYGAYPQSLQGLVPELLRHPPADFIDGQPLRYRLTEDGHFVLYSVGLDCVDNGGKLRRPAREVFFRYAVPGARYDDRPEPRSGVVFTRRYDGYSEYGTEEGTDLVWLRPASAVEIQALRVEEHGQEEQE